MKRPTRLYAMHCGYEGGDLACFDPFDAHVGTKVEIPYFFYVIEHPDGVVLFDTGAHRAFIDGATERLGSAADAFDIHMEPGDDLASQLLSLGIQVKDVPHVALSHLHYDHAGGLDTLSNAMIHVQHNELVFAHWPPVYQRSLYIQDDFREATIRWNEIDGEHDIFNDGSLLLFPTPGHTPGHQSLLVLLAERPVILIGDAAYLPNKMRERILPGIVWSADAMIASWERIEQLEREHGAQLLFTHDIDWQNTTKVGPEGWYQ